MKNWALPIFVLMALQLALESGLGCVGCREPGAETIAKESPTVLAGWAFSWSVLFMLCFALMIVAGMSLYIWRTCRRLDREAALRMSDG